MTIAVPATPSDILNHLLTLTPAEEILACGGGRGRLRRLAFTLDHAQKALAPLELYQSLNAGRPGVLYESVDIAPIYGRYSLAVIDPPIIVEGKDEHFAIRALNDRGKEMLKIPIYLVDLSRPNSWSGRNISGRIQCERRAVAEDERLRLKNISQVIRDILQVFRCDDHLLGLYGAFAYDFVRLFEVLPDTQPVIPTKDFRLFMPDTIIRWDHMRERTVLYLYDFINSAKSPTELLRERLAGLDPVAPRVSTGSSARVPRQMTSDMGRKAYMTAVDDAREQMRLGEFFEVVLSHSFKGHYDRSPLELYRRFREINPSPYQFYIDYGDEALVGASPEMFVRVENGIVQQRPISGTMPRGTDALSDYHNMMRLLNSEKEKSELDMLIDLARNDVSRVCEPGVAVSDYRYVEKYSRVMHTVAQVQGCLAPGWTAFDAFIASLNAGTLTGAPKAAAMTYIATHEKSRRGYYGGNVGYLTFSGQLDTGIIIRTAHLVRQKGGAKDNYDVTVRAGSTLLYDSDPASEYAETEVKARALLEALDSIERPITPIAGDSRIPPEYEVFRAMFPNKSREAW